jgi:hypothetical protein
VVIAKQSKFLMLVLFRGECLRFDVVGSVSDAEGWNVSSSILQTKNERVIL